MNFNFKIRKTNVPIKFDLKKTLITVLEPKPQFHFRKALHKDKTHVHHCWYSRLRTWPKSPCVPVHLEGPIVLAWFCFIFYLVWSDFIRVLVATVHNVIHPSIRPYVDAPYLPAYIYRWIPSFPLDL